LHGCYQSWIAEGYAISSDISAPEPAAFPLDDSAAGIMIDTSEMLDAIDKPDIIKLDI
jgi:thiosulfate/3-mercaptopyruvate sulfurtransferase